MTFGYHDFRSDLARAQAAQRLPCWDAEWYPRVLANDFVRRELRDADGPDQRDCIDAIVHLRTSHAGHARSLRVEEKVRFQWYDDFLFEVWSDWDRRTPGWGVKTARADYLSYRILPNGKGWFIPFHALQAAWTRFGQDWIEAQKTSRRPDGLVSAFNGRWVTKSVIVPEAVLLDSIRDCLVVRISERPEWEEPRSKFAREWDLLRAPHRRTA